VQLHTLYFGGMIRIPFAELPWETVSPGLRQKIGPGCRLLEHLPEHVEETWCTRGHRGYVVDGVLELELAEERILLGAGDALDIPEGLPHKGHVHPGGRALLFLVES